VSTCCKLTSSRLHLFTVQLPSSSSSSTAERRLLANTHNSSCCSLVCDCRNYGLFAPLPFRPLDDSPPGSFAPWLVRPRTWYHCNTMTETVCLQLSFHSFSRFSISITFIQRKTTVQQHDKSKSFPTNLKAKVNIILYTFDVWSQIYFSIAI